MTALLTGWLLIGFAIWCVDVIAKPRAWWRYAGWGAELGFYLPSTLVFWPFGLTTIGNAIRR